MHRVAWALQNSKAIGPICEKPWQNQGFRAERTGTELVGVFPVFLKEFERYYNPARLGLSVRVNSRFE
jgi:hypothetical protein